jgi:ParB family chromosome partitioning protein
MSTATVQKKPALALGRLSQVAQIPVRKADAEISLSLIDVERQVRTDLGDLGDLVNTIKAVGVKQPIMLLAKPDGRYRLIAGERRFRASHIAGRDKIPAVIEKGPLTEFEIRILQITENNDRENLSAYDEAMGVAEDVSKYGFKEALRIWNRSEGWVSKRSGVAKYGEPVLELLKTRVCGDLEVLHGLNQLHDLAKPEFQVLEQRLRAGEVVSREDVRSRVAMAKAWAKGGAQQGSDQAGGLGVDRSDQAGDHHPEAGRGPEEESGPSTTPALDSGPSARQERTSQRKGPAPASKPAIPEVADRTAAAAKLLRKRTELAEWGVATKDQVAEISRSLESVDAARGEAEWVFWTAFLDTVLPMLSALGPERSAAYVKRLQLDLKGRSAQELWDVLHPDAAMAEPAPIPEGWSARTLSV